jgi:Replication initiator protein, pSAM2
MLGFGGHFLTKSRYYSITFRLLRQERIVWRQELTAGPQQDRPAEQPTVLVVNFLDFVGAGWHTTGDAFLASTAAAKAREQRKVAREELTYASTN